MAGGGMPIAGGTIAGGFLTGKALIVPLSLIISLFFLWGFSYGLLDGQYIFHSLSEELTRNKIVSRLCSSALVKIRFS